jgi:hypothetical protein
MSAYLSKKELNFIKIDDINPDDFIARDTYNETELIKTLLSKSKEEQKWLLKVAIHVSIIGSGNRNFGFIKNENGQPVELESIIKKLGINYTNGQDAKLEPGELSVRRLTRLFRYQINEFIRKTGRESYLYRKYDLLKNKNMVAIVFPGAEHLVETVDQAKYLFEVYRQLDKVKGTKFCDRLNRVFIARGIITKLFE